MFFDPMLNSITSDSVSVSIPDLMIIEDDSTPKA
jgi:hypothetical protein